MFILALFDTAGYIFGPIIVLAGVVALILCVRASGQSQSLKSRRQALFGSLTPFAAGLCGAVVGLIVCLSQDRQPVQWLALGKVCLAGLAVTALPLVWSLGLFLGPRPMAKGL